VTSLEAGTKVRTAYVRVKSIEEGRVLAWALALFDLCLGTVALGWPRLYAEIFHPRLDDPQLDLIRRMGVIWLMFCTVAIITATRHTRTIVRWFQVLAVLRLMEVPADLLYGTLDWGATWWSRALLYSAPPINLAAGIFLYRISQQRWSTLQTIVSGAVEQGVDRGDGVVGAARR
jgi:hypothetical protein